MAGEGGNIRKNSTHEGGTVIFDCLPQIDLAIALNS